MIYSGNSRGLSFLNFCHLFNFRSFSFLTLVCQGCYSRPVVYIAGWIHQDRVVNFVPFQRRLRAGIDRRAGVVQPRRKTKKSKTRELEKGEITCWQCFLMRCCGVLVDIRAATHSFHRQINTLDRIVSVIVTTNKMILLDVWTAVSFVGCSVSLPMRWVFSNN